MNLYEILLSDKPSFHIRKNEDYVFSLIPGLDKCKGFNQNNIWHIYDVYEHILHVVDGVPNNLTIRLAALFHDVGKPDMYTLDENGVGHFYNHWVRSREVFEEFAIKYNLDPKIKDSVSKLIFYHDIRLEKVGEEVKDRLANDLDKEEMTQLFQLKRSDLLAQNPQFHNLLSMYDEQEKEMMSKCRR